MLQWLSLELLLFELQSNVAEPQKPIYTLTVHLQKIGSPYYGALKYCTVDLEARAEEGFYKSKLPGSGFAET